MANDSSANETVKSPNRQPEFKIALFSGKYKSLNKKSKKGHKPQSILKNSNYEDINEIKVSIFDTKKTKRVAFNPVIDVIIVRSLKSYNSVLIEPEQNSCCKCVIF